MTNLEYYKDEINGFIKEKSFGSVSCAIKYGFEEFAIKYIENYKNRPCEFVDWLLSEHKEPIKLKKWEYDMIRTNDMSHNNEFWFFGTYRHMKNAGYFKGVYNVNMTLKEILENCEIEDEKS